MPTDDKNKYKIKTGKARAGLARIYVIGDAGFTDRIGTEIMKPAIAALSQREVTAELNK